VEKDFTEPIVSYLQSELIREDIAQIKDTPKKGSSKSKKSK
jgi:hypothetical protein